MAENFIAGLRRLPSFDRAIISDITLYKDERLVEINIVTDKVFTAEDKAEACACARKCVPSLFGVKLNVTKLSPDCDMVARKIAEMLPSVSKTVSAFVTENDIKVEKTETGFFFTLSVVNLSHFSQDIAEAIASSLSKIFCGEFKGKCEISSKSIDDVEIEEKHENVEYIVPVRKFKIADFAFLEGSEEQKEAVYLADMNFTSESVTVCGVIEDIRERSFKRNNGQEKKYYGISLSDTTAVMRATYFTRQRSIEKIKNLKVGDSIVMTGRSELFHGEVRFTANFIDYGKIPENFVPEKRKSKPVPKYYEFVRPAPYSDITQTDLFSERTVPECMKGRDFVVFDLETTGLNSSPSSGNMDRIIEIGAYKIKDGVIKESFTTFINPERKLSEEIMNLTGIKQEDVDGAPTYRQALPDFFKFCEGAYLVGHNAAGFDFKFIDYYLQQLGYIQERKIYDTIPLSQELLFLSNYKLNTVADKFGITFNHHRAIDDALVTAKIFIELIKIKKSLPKPC